MHAQHLQACPGTRGPCKHAPASKHGPHLGVESDVREAQNGRHHDGHVALVAIRVPQVDLGASQVLKIKETGGGLVFGQVVLANVMT